MGLKAKITLVFVSLAVLIVVLLTIFSLVSFRQFSISTAKEHARSAAEIVRLHLTESMVQGTISSREGFLNRLKHIQGLEDARVVRGAAVVRQYGKGLTGETEMDGVEQEVIRSGQPFFGLTEDKGPPVFRATIPYIARSDRQPNCLQCHEVDEGTTLGAVSLRISLSEQRRAGIYNAVLIVGVLSFFTLLAVLLARRIITPLLGVAGQIQEVMHDARQGDFSGRIQHEGSDEVAQIARDLNDHMHFLQNGLTTISNQVADLMRYERKTGGNVLSVTLEMVQSLVDASHYKQAIEEDETQEEVYSRLTEIFQEQFGLDYFTIYEVDSNNNRMTGAKVACPTESDCAWCDPNVLVRADTCRAKRTGRVVNSTDNPGICTAFAPTDSNVDDWRHVCIPIIQSGSVGAVVQLVSRTSQVDLLRESLPFIQVYLRETAPVLEAKRLTAHLRESALRDAMTGLHNRRFMEEYIDTLVAYTERNNTSFSVLMLDVDYFKKVNDTYGHEVGDEVLKEVAKTLRQHLRSSDIVVRYGGEEFLAIIRDNRDSPGDKVAEKIRLAVEEAKIRVAGTTLQKTISIGVADFPGDSASVWQVIKYADVALYKAKENGRNQVMHFAPEMWKDQDEF